MRLPSLPRNGRDAGLGRRMLTVPRSRRRTGAHSRLQPRRGACMSLTTESLRPCVAARGITTPGEFPRRPCDFRHERQSSAILVSSLAHMQARICRAFMQKCALRVVLPTRFRHDAHTALTRRSPQIQASGNRVAAGGTHVAFSFPNYCIERPCTSTCARVAKSGRRPARGVGN